MDTKKEDRKKNDNYPEVVILYFIQKLFIWKVVFFYETRKSVDLRVGLRIRVT